MRRQMGGGPLSITRRRVEELDKGSDSKFQYEVMSDAIVSPIGERNAMMIAATSARWHCAQCPSVLIMQTTCIVLII